MYVKKNIINWFGCLSLAFFFGGCTSAVFPDVVEVDQANVGGTITEEEDDFSDDSLQIRKAAPGEKVRLAMPTEGKTLVGDKTNAAYETGEKVIEENEIVKQVEPAKTAPVSKSNVDDVLSLPENKPEIMVDAKSAANIHTVEEDYVPSVTYRLDTFYFADGSAVLDAKYNAAVRQAVKEAKAKHATITVIGFASSRTRNTDPYSHKMANFEVSLKRAQAVANALKRAGFPARDIKVEALSDSAPNYVEVMPEGERLNRRAEIYLSY